MATQEAFPPGWEVVDGKAMLRVETEDFAQAVHLVNRIALVAEELDHHPDLHLEEYCSLRVVTWSHDVGGLTPRDERLAQAVHRVLVDEGVLPQRAG